MCYKVTVDSIWEVKVISNSLRFFSNRKLMNIKHFSFGKLHLRHWSFVKWKSLLRRCVIICRRGCKKKSFACDHRTPSRSLLFLLYAHHVHLLACNRICVWERVIPDYRILPCFVLPLTDQ